MAGSRSTAATAKRSPLRSQPLPANKTPKSFSVKPRRPRVADRKPTGAGVNAAAGSPLGTTWIRSGGVP